MKGFGLFVGEFFFNGGPLDFKGENGGVDLWRVNMSCFVIDGIYALNGEMVADTGSMWEFFYCGEQFAIEVIHMFGKLGVVVHRMKCGVGYSMEDGTIEI